MLLRLVLSTFLLAAATSVGFAQPATFGVQAGSGWHILRNQGGAFFSDPLVMTGIGIGNVGGYATIPVKGSFAFRPEIHLNYRSIAGKLVLDVDEEEEEVQLGLEKSGVRDLFVELPLLVEYRINDEISTIAGVSVNGLIYSVKEQLKTDSTDLLAPPLRGSLALENRNQLEFAYIVGGQFKFSKQWGIGFRFVRSLTNFYRAAAYRSFSLRYSTWAMNSTYTF